MEEKGITVFTLSDFIRRGRPFTATSSLVCRQVSTSECPKISNQKTRRKPSFSTDGISYSQTLKPLTQPAVLVGTLNLPSVADSNVSISCSCFQFSDDSSTVCCEVLDFDTKMIGKRIRILAWNFIPFKRRNKGVNGGMLEIITWELCQSYGQSVCSLSNSCSVCITLGACEFKDNCKASSLIFGLMVSISPAFNAPCASAGGGLKNTRGFLVNILVCQCEFCRSKLVSDVNTLCGKNIKGHYFKKNVTLYFIGQSSSWHPVISRFIGEIVLIKGLKKKLVFITKGESQLMHVTTEEISFHIVSLLKEQIVNQNVGLREKGEGGAYTGVITSVYMQGMIVELDQDVILLLSDEHLTVPHCVRVGAIVTIKNVHFVDPKFLWGKMLILGACYRTSLHVHSFSPLETGSHLKTHTQSLLQKFIDSLPFAARLWALLLVSSFRKKFAGILSEKTILGSKHMEGLAQKYAAWHLPSSAFQSRHGVLVEFCRHNLCSRATDGQYGHLRLVLPIANLISYCESSWKKSLVDDKIISGSVSATKQKRALFCRGRSYLQTIKRSWRSKDIGVLILGNLKISLMSGRLQLVDATGGIDIMLDIPASWGFDGIFEASDFTLIMEGIPLKLIDLDSSICQPLSCRSIFCNFLPSRRIETSIYLYHNLTDGDSRSRSNFFDWKRNHEELECGNFHLLLLTHKFPIHRKPQGDLAKVSNMFAEAISLPWDLLVTKRCEGATTDILSSVQHWIDSSEKLNESEKFPPLKRCKMGQGPIETSSHGLKDHGNELIRPGNSQIKNLHVSSCLVEFPCVVTGKAVNFHLGKLRCTNRPAMTTDSDRKTPTQKVLLEFAPDSFCTYEALKIGHCFLVKHQEGDVLCSMKENYQVTLAKVYIGSQTFLWSLTLSSIESLKISDASFEIQCLAGNGSIDKEVFGENKVHVTSTALNFLKKDFSVLDGKFVEPRDAQENSDIHDHNGSMLNVSAQSNLDCPLPKGNLITLHGLVMALHDVNGDALPTPLRPTPGESYLLRFLQGSGGVCIHVLVDNRMVRIFCDTSKQNYPVGLGRDAYATFHRILVLGEQNTYMMMPISFITINNTNSFDVQDNCSSGNIGSSRVALPHSLPVALLSDVLQISELKPIQFHCRIVGVYVLLLEKVRPTSVFQPSFTSIPSVGIPFVSFFMDDGSSSCCCWANSGVAATLLQLDCGETLLECPINTFGYKKAGSKLPHPRRSIVGRLNKILDHYGKIVVKTCAPIFDSSYQDLAFFANSGRLISREDEDVVRSIISAAIISTSWTIRGSVMDPETTEWLEEQLREVDMAVPATVNIWVKSADHTNLLAEARNIIGELM